MQLAYDGTSKLLFIIPVLISRIQLRRLMLVDDVTSNNLLDRAHLNIQK